MGRSLYDLLEVSEIASDEVIHAAYSRLSEKLKTKIAKEDAPDAEVQLKAIHDAYRMLSNPQSRKRYDDSLAMKNVVYEEEAPFWTKTKVALLGVLVVLAIGAYAKHSRDIEREQTERARIAADQAEKDRQVKLEEEKIRLEREQEMQSRQDAAQQQVQIERDRRYADAISSRVNQGQSYTLQRTEREQRAEQQRADYEQRRQEQEARRQVEAEKRKLQQLEYENHTNRPAITVVPRR